jgi:CSLREA domain-containing protein
MEKFMKTKKAAQFLLCLFLLLTQITGSAVYQAHAATPKAINTPYKSVQEQEAIITVTTTTDEINNNGSCSLREAIINANANARPNIDCSAGHGDDLINFIPSLDGSFIVMLTSQLPNISDAAGLTIDGEARTIINGSGSYRALYVAEAAKLTLINISITNTYHPSEGGAIFNAGDLFIINSRLYNNVTPYQGGAIYQSNITGASLVIENSIFDDNFTGTKGGAITIAGGEAHILSGQFINNETDNSSGDGGAIYLAAGDLYIRRSAFFSNRARYGGAIYSLSGDLLIFNSTIAENAALAGGGITIITGNTIISNSTITHNAANSGGLFVLGNAKVFLYNNIIANTSFGTYDCNSSSLTDFVGNNNLIERIDPSYPCEITNGTNGNIVGVDPKLAAPVYTPPYYYPLLMASPARDAGSGCEPIDQRGVPRPQGTFCDIGSYEIDITSATISSIVRASASPTSADNVDFTVTFSEPVQNVNEDDFILTKSSGISDAYIINVFGSDASYTVTINTGTGSGNLRLDVPASATIQDLSNNTLEGLPYTNGETYTKVMSTIIKSNAANDGWILESSETSNTGGTMNSVATTFILGDDAIDKQYRTILHFDTASLPDNAVVTNMTLKVKQQGAVTGVSPFTFASLYVDMRNPAFGGSALELADFNFAAKKVKSAVFNPIPVSGWFSARFNNGGRLYVNRTGVTQLRLYFSVDDNNNNVADFIRFFSGNAAAGDRPKLLIQYQLP